MAKEVLSPDLYYEMGLPWLEQRKRRREQAALSMGSTLGVGPRVARAITGYSVGSGMAAAQAEYAAALKGYSDYATKMQKEKSDRMKYAAQLVESEIESIRAQRVEQMKGYSGIQKQEALFALKEKAAAEERMKKAAQEANGTPSPRVDRANSTWQSYVASQVAIPDMVMDPTNPEYVNNLVHSDNLGKLVEIWESLPTRGEKKAFIDANPTIQDAIKVFNSPDSDTYSNARGDYTSAEGVKFRPLDRARGVYAEFNAEGVKADADFERAYLAAHEADQKISEIDPVLGRIEGQASERLRGLLSSMGVGETGPGSSQDPVLAQHAARVSAALQKVASPEPTTMQERRAITRDDPRLQQYMTEKGISDPQRAMRKMAKDAGYTKRQLRQAEKGKGELVGQQDRYIKSPARQAEVRGGSGLSDAASILAGARTDPHMNRSASVVETDPAPAVITPEVDPVEEATMKTGESHKELLKLREEARRASLFQSGAGEQVPTR